MGAAVQRFVEGLDYPAWDFWTLYKPGLAWGDDAPGADDIVLQASKAAEPLYRSLGFELQFPIAHLKARSAR